MKILWHNEVDINDQAASTEHIDYPLSNLVDPRLSRVFRTTDDDDEYIVISGTDITADAIAILNHNITSGATIKIQGNDTDAWGAPSFEQSITWAEYAIFQTFTSGEYNYWRLFIDDASNPDEYIQIGRLFLGEVLEMPGMKADQEIDDGITDSVDFSPSGQVYGDTGIDYRTMTINFPYISEDERVDIREMADDRRLSEPFVLDIWPGDTREKVMYCVLTTMPKWKRSDDRNYIWQLQMIVREVF